MGASVGIGGLIVGISMLVVFSMAITTLSEQTASSLEVIESAQQSDPIITIDNANFIPIAVHSIEVTDGGSGYLDGFLTSSSCPGFSASFTVDAGIIEDSVTIENPGSCSVVPTDITVLAQTDTSPTFNVVTQSYLFANLTNDGSETISTETAWLFFDGTSPQTIASASFVVEEFENWFSGETVELFWNDANDHTRMSLTVGETRVSRVITSI
jgi:hypothetical protein